MLVLRGSPTRKRQIQNRLSVLSAVYPPSFGAERGCRAEDATLKGWRYI